MMEQGDREAAFAERTESQLDDFIATGRAALHNLVEQRNILKVHIFPYYIC